MICIKIALLIDLSVDAVQSGNGKKEEHMAEVLGYGSLFSSKLHFKDAPFEESLESILVETKVQEALAESTLESLCCF